MKILVLAGGFDQIALIQELKFRGHEVILVDYLEKPLAQKYANKHYQLSTLDEEAVLYLAKQEKVNLITTACTDQALMTVANVSEKLGLSFYLDAEMARNVTNKIYMKGVLKSHNIPTAEFFLLNKKNKITQEVTKTLRFPVVVKPCDCNSSKGVIKVENKELFFQAVNKAFSLSRNKQVLEGVPIG